MSELIATPVVKNKFWVVENHGNKIATIQAREDGGFVYVHDNQREYFPSTKDIKRKFNIKFEAAKKITKNTNNEVYGYPITGKAYNQVYDVQRKLPIYSKLSKSKSFYCAGYYLIKLNDMWTTSYCPKNITLNRYEFKGPFKTDKEMQIELRRCKNATN